MCCSDKLLRWNILGWQGALLSHFVPAPIYMETIVISGRSFCRKSVKRALFDRVDCDALNKILTKHSLYRLQYPIVIHSKLSFPFSQPVPAFNKNNHNVDISVKRCGSALSWCSNVPFKPVQVIAKGGFLLGATKKTDPKKSRPLISRSCLYELFKEILVMIPKHSSLSDKLSSQVEIKCYRSYKKASLLYTNIWRELKSSLFNSWVSHNPALDEFT